MYASSGVVNIKKFLDKFSDVKRDARNHSFIAMFPMCDIGSQRQEDLSALLMVTGYIAKKTMLRMTCEACKQKFGNRELQQLNLEIDSDLLRYFESINRGGLTYPSNVLFNSVHTTYRRVSRGVGGPRGLAPPLEIEKQKKKKKKRSSEQILSYSTYILLLF